MNDEETIKPTDLPTSTVMNYIDSTGKGYIYFPTCYPEPNHTDMERERQNYEARERYDKWEARIEKILFVLSIVLLSGLLGFVIYLGILMF